jgi:hypothetical protein
MFVGCLSENGNADAKKLSPFISKLLDEDEDVAIKNLIGCGDVAGLARRWADSGSTRRKLEIAREYLKPPERVIVDRVLGTSVSYRHSPPSMVNKGKEKAIQELRYGTDDDTDEDDADDERGRTAHRLFASLAGVDEKETSWWYSSSPSDKERQAYQAIVTPVRRGSSKMVPCKPFPNQPPPLLTPVSSPIRPAEKAPSGQIRQLTTPSPSHRNSGRSLASPICLLSSSPLQTIFSLEPKSELKVPEKFALKSPLAEQKNRISEDMESSLTCHYPDFSGAGSSQNRSKSPILHFLSSQVSNFSSPGAGEQVLEHKSLVVRRTKPASSLRRASHTRSPLPKKRQVQPAHPYLQRIRIGERLALSRPDAVAPSYASKRQNLFRRYVRLETKESYAQAVAEIGDVTSTSAPDNPTIAKGSQQQQSSGGGLRNEPTVLSFDDVVDIENDDGGMDWNRSRDLADEVRGAIANGRPISLPALKCADSQSSQYAFR